MFIDLNKQARSDLSNRTTIDDHDLAVHEAVSIADEKSGVFGKLSRAAEASLGDPEFVHLKETLGQCVAEVGVEDTGRDRIDGDAKISGLA